MTGPTHGEKGVSGEERQRERDKPRERGGERKWGRERERERETERERKSERKKPRELAKSAGGTLFLGHLAFTQTSCKERERRGQKSARVSDSPLDCEL